METKGSRANWAGSATMDLEKDGFTLLRAVISPDQCDKISQQVTSALDQNERAAIHGSGDQPARSRLVGGRNLLSLWDGWRPLVEHPAVADLIGRQVGSGAGLVRGLYFDKPPGQGWALALHRDRTIAVAEHCEPAEPFSKPTRKGGVPHVQATNELLDRMLTIRLHLDPMCDQNGPLVVIPSSHRDNESESSSADAIPIHCDAGDLFVMRPRLVHGSRACDPDTEMHRRVIHLEIAPSQQLPGGYRWHQFEPVIVY